MVIIIKHLMKNNLEKEYNYNASNLEYDKKIDIHKNLSLII